MKERIQLVQRDDGGWYRPDCGVEPPCRFDYWDGLPRRVVLTKGERTITGRVAPHVNPCARHATQQQEPPLPGAEGREAVVTPYDAALREAVASDDWRTEDLLDAKREGYLAAVAEVRALAAAAWDVEAVADAISDFMASVPGDPSNEREWSSVDMATAIAARIAPSAPAAEATEADLGDALKALDMLLREWNAWYPNLTGYAKEYATKTLRRIAARAAGDGAGYKAARGVAPLQPGEELPEARIRRIRDGEA